MRVAYLDCYSGISGDMTLGAFLDAGLSSTRLRDHLALLDLDGYRLATEPVTQASILGTRLTVDVDARPRRGIGTSTSHDHHDHDHGAHRHWGNSGLIEGSRLPAAMKATGAAYLQPLAEAEGAVHGRPPDAVHFHEVGAVELDRRYRRRGGRPSVARRRAALRCAVAARPRLRRHPPRPPAAARPGDAGSDRPHRRGDARRRHRPAELVTPTGAAIAGALATFAQPPMRTERIGYGYGTMAPLAERAAPLARRLDEAAAIRRRPSRRRARKSCSRRTSTTCPAKSSATSWTACLRPARSTSSTRRSS